MLSVIKSDVKRECNNTKEGIGVVQGYDYPVAWQHVQHGVVKTPKQVLFCLCSFREEHCPNPHLHSSCWSVEEVKAGPL